MENRKYAPAKKGILIIINMFCVTILGLSLMVGMMVLSDCGGDITSLAKNKTYVNSTALKEQLSNDISEIGYYLQLKEKFETKEIFDEDKMINVFDFSPDDYIPGQSKHPLEYRLGDLLNWTKQATDYQDWINNDGLSENNVSIAELYQPEGYASIEVYAKANGSNAFQCYGALALALSNIQSQVSDYYHYTNFYNSENTNIRYSAINKKTKAEFTQIEDSGALVVKATDTVGNYEIKAGIDTTFAVKDSYYYANKNYNKYGPYSYLILLGILLGALGTAITIIWLTILAGHKNSEKESSILPIDKIPVEISVVVWFLIALGVFAILGSTASNFYYEYETYLVIAEGIAIFFGTGIFLIGYLSLIRMIKAKIVVKNSICHKLKRCIVFTVKNIKITWRITGFFIVFLIINFFLSLSYWWNGMGFLIALVFNVFIGTVIFKDAVARQHILEGITNITNGDLDYKVDVSNIRWANQEIAEAVNKIGAGLQNAVDASIKNERTKTDLITNVSHDIKTPLTSIINYVDLLKRENIKDEKIRGYIDILDNKSQRLKQLTEDLVEASKVSSGNITLELIVMDFNELLQQTIGEFKDKFQNRNLTLIVNHPEIPVIIEADGRRVWRIIENIFNNIAKYAMPSTRVYIELKVVEGYMELAVKNVSEYALNITAEELTERFIRGDISRSTEGSGLGLSIAKSLTKLQHGDFDIYLDGDLFKVMVKFKLKSEIK